MGVLVEYATRRIDEMTSEARDFLSGPVKYLQTKQPLRKALLVEWLDNVRPNIGARWTPRVPELTGKPIIPRIRTEL